MTHNQFNTQFNPSSTMNTMMMSNHIMGQFNNLMNTNTTFYETISDSKFISQTMIIFIQIFAVSVFSAFSNHLTGIFGNFKYFIEKIITKYIIGFILYPIFWLYSRLYKIYHNEKPKYKITRNISLITSEFKRNGELLEIIQWFISSEFCKKVKKNNLIKTNVKEIYYPSSSEKTLFDFNFKNNDKIDFSVSNLLNDDFIIMFNDCGNNCQINCYRTKTEIELKGDIETQKRDNITYYLETYDENEDSNIIEKFCDFAVKTYNSNRVEWKQQIFNNNGSGWMESKDIFSPSSVDTVILRDGIKEDFVSSLDFFTKNKNFYKDHGQRYKYVTVMLGPPGTGKTTLAIAYANQNKKHIYALNLNESKQGDLKNLIETMDTSKGDLLIDDFDHYFSQLGNNNCDQNHQLINQEDDLLSEEDDYSSRKKSKKTKVKPNISYHELLTVLDGTGSKEGLNIYICINNPSKLFNSKNIEDFALFRDRRVNKIIEFKYCDHKMITGIYKNIFRKEPNKDLIKMIKEDYYSPCVIAQQFISFVERNGGNFEDKQVDIDLILSNLINNRIETNQDKIISYIQNLKDYNKEKVL